MTNYQDFIIQTYENHGEPSNKPVRATAIPGQGVATDKKVACSEDMRLSYPVGTLFKVKCKVTNREGGTPFLYRHPSWEYEVVSPAEAKEFIKKNFNS